MAFLTYLKGIAMADIEGKVMTVIFYTSLVVAVLLYSVTFYRVFTGKVCTKETTLMTTGPISFPALRLQPCSKHENNHNP